MGARLGDQSSRGVDWVRVRGAVGWTVVRESGSALARADLGDVRG